MIPKTKVSKPLIITKLCFFFLHLKKGWQAWAPGQHTTITTCDLFSSKKQTPLIRTHNFEHSLDILYPNA